MKIGLSGATGFIGGRVKALCERHGHEVVPFSRRPAEGARLWNDVPDVSGLDAMVNLAGEPIMGLWTRAKKQRIRESRVHGTRNLVQAMTHTRDEPRILINASAVGFYGETGETLVDESSPAGDGFLAEVCEAWEAEAMRAGDSGIRVVCIRTGFVLGRGGALKLMAPVFRAALGGRLGSGRQWMSGIHVDDVAGIVRWAVETDAVRGPVNAVLPEPFRNEDFTREFARAAHRPACLPVPAFALRLGLGEMADFMLESVRVRPARALSEGYVFQFASLPAALQDALG
jgi:uncharacterized protein (TIGR01777 family)